MLDEGKEEVVGGVVEEDGEVKGGGDPIVGGGALIVTFAFAFGEVEVLGGTFIVILLLPPGKVEEEVPRGSQVWRWPRLRGKSKAQSSVLAAT